MPFLSHGVLCHWLIYVKKFRLSQETIGAARHLDTVESTPRDQFGLEIVCYKLTVSVKRPIDTTSSLTPALRWIFLTALVKMKSSKRLDQKNFRLWRPVSKYFAPSWMWMGKNGVMMAQIRVLTSTEVTPHAWHRERLTILTFTNHSSMIGKLIRIQLSDYLQERLQIT